MSGKFIANPGLEAHLLRSTAVRDHMETVAQDAAETYAASVAFDEGDLAESVFGDVALTPEGFVGRVGATDWKAALVEFGTVEHAPDGSLRAALEELGLKIEAS